MASGRSGRGPRRTWAGAALLAALLTGCAGRIPILVPPPGGVEAVEGFASASITGAEASVKGRFAFLFRRPGLGRVEAVDPLGRTVFLVHFREGRAWFVVPSKKAYAEADAETMMERIIGVVIRPDEVLALLSGLWPEPGPEGGWTVSRDEQGRVAEGERDECGFTVRAFFRGGAAPRDVVLFGPGTTGRLKVLKLAFDPAARDAAFETGFLGRFTAKSWEEILELLER
jgi:outer membrane biogenesis lipoprotein LolB